MATKKRTAKDFERLPGPERYYVDKRSGSIVPRSERDRAITGKTLHKRTAENVGRRGELPKVRQYTTLVRSRMAFLNKHKEKGQPEYSYNEVSRSPEMKQLIKDLRTESNAATGHKARALVELGRRDPNWTGDVGESLPPRKHKRMRRNKKHPKGRR